MDIVKAFNLLMIQENPETVLVPGDKGGITKFGIAQNSHPELDVVNLTKDEAISVYAAQYWGPGKCSSLKSELQYIHFSSAVNCGVGSANKILQRACRVTVDGIPGAATIQAAQNISIQDYAIEWAAHYTAIINNDPSQLKFKNGWNNRIDRILQWYKEQRLN